MMRDHQVIRCDNNNYVPAMIQSDLHRILQLLRDFLTFQNANDVFGMTRKERADALRQAILRQDATDHEVIRTINGNRDLLDPALNEPEEAENLWEAAIVSNRYEVMSAMVESLECHDLTSFIFKKAAFYNRARLFRLFLELFPYDPNEVLQAVEVAWKRGFVSILQTAWEFGVPMDMLAKQLTISLKAMKVYQKNDLLEWNAYHAALLFALDHDLLDAAAFESMIPFLWDCAQCEQIVDDCLDRLGFDPQSYDIADAVEECGVTSLWWAYNSHRTWSLRDCAEQSLALLMCVLSTDMMKPTRSERARRRMWEVVDVILALNPRVIMLPPGVVSSRFRVNRDHPLLYHIFMDGNYRLLLHCWPYLMQEAAAQVEEESPFADRSVWPSTARGWLHVLSRHPAVKVALACQETNWDAIGTVFTQILRPIAADAWVEVGPWKHPFNQVCGHLLIWLLGIDPDLAEVFLTVLLQTVRAVYPPNAFGRVTCVLGALLSGHLDCMIRRPDLTQISFFERHIASVSPITFQQCVLNLPSMDADFYRLIRYRFTDVSLLNYFVSEERMNKEKRSENINLYILCTSIIEVLEMFDPSIATESLLAVEKFTWIVQYVIRTYGSDALSKRLTVMDRVSIVRSGHIEAVRLMKQYGVLVNASSGDTMKVLIAACETGNLAVAEMIAEAVYEREGAHGWLSLLDRHSAVYTAEVAAEIHSHVHLQHWLRDLQQRAREMISASPPQTDWNG